MFGAADRPITTALLVFWVKQPAHIVLQTLLDVIFIPVRKDWFLTKAFYT